MKTHIHSARSVRLASRCLGAAAAIAALAASACSSGPSDDVASTHQAITAYENLSIDASQFGAIVSALGVASCTLTVTNNQGVFTPSQPLAWAIWGLGATPAEHALDVTIPSFTVDTPNPFGPYTITVASLQTSGTSQLTADLEGTYVHVGAVFSGTLYASSPNVLQPNFDIDLTSVTIDVYIDVTDDSLTLDHMNVAVNASASGCLADICDNIVDSQLGSVSSQLKSALQPYIAQEISSPAVYGGFVAALLQQAAVQEQSTGGAGWALAEAPTLQDSTISYEVYGTLPPNAPQCSPYETTESCNGSISVTCAPNADTLVLYEQINGAWLEQGSGGPDLSGPYPGVGTITYRVCSQDAAGSSCTAPFAFTTTAPSGCKTGGGGSSGKGCGGHVCEQ